MKKTALLFLLLFSNIHADDLNVVDPLSQKKTLLPMTNAEYRKHVPLIPRMLTEKERILKAQEEKATKLREATEKRKTQEKINKNFAEKETLQQVKKVKTDIKIDDTKVDFFNSLSETDSAPINME